MLSLRCVSWLFKSWVGLIRLEVRRPSAEYIVERKTHGKSKVPLSKPDLLYIKDFGLS